jgi:hypothetical protein
MFGDTIFYIIFYKPTKSKLRVIDSLEYEMKTKAPCTLTNHGNERLEFGKQLKPKKTLAMRGVITISII